MESINPLGFASRVVNDAQRDGQPARVVSGARTFAADAENIWDAVTNPERLDRWFLPVTGDLELSGRYQLEGNAGGEITRCEPCETLELTWDILTP